MKPGKADRIDWIDHAKGIGIFLVVLGHTYRGIHAAKLMNTSQFQPVDDWIYAFHMPLFFLLSGVFAERLQKLKIPEFFLNRLAALVAPYLIWATIQLLFQASFSRYTNSVVGLEAFQWILILPFSQYWFLYILLLVSLIYYLLRALGTPITVVLALSLVLFFSGPVLHLEFWPPLLQVCGNLIFYTLGSCLSWNGFLVRLNRGHWANLLLTIVGGYLAVTLMVDWNVEKQGLVGLLVALSGILASSSLAVLFERMVGFNWIRILGIYSLEIYVTHTIFGSGTRIILSKLFHINNTMVHTVVGVMVSLLLPLAFTILCRRLGLDFLFRIPLSKPGGTRNTTSNPVKG